jgi:hypothetical protein
MSIYASEILFGFDKANFFEFCAGLFKYEAYDKPFNWIDHQGGEYIIKSEADLPFILKYNVSVPIEVSFFAQVTGRLYFIHYHSPGTYSWQDFYDIIQNFFLSPTFLNISVLLIKSLFSSYQGKIREEQPGLYKHATLVYRPVFQRINNALGVCGKEYLLFGT